MSLIKLVIHICTNNPVSISRIFHAISKPGTTTISEFEQRHSLSVCETINAFFIALLRFQLKSVLILSLLDIFTLLLYSPQAVTNKESNVLPYYIVLHRKRHDKSYLCYQNQKSELQVGTKESTSKNSLLSVEQLHDMVIGHSKFLPLALSSENVDMLCSSHSNCSKYSPRASLLSLLHRFYSIEKVCCNSSVLRALLTSYTASLTEEDTMICAILQYYKQADILQLPNPPSLNVVDGQIEIQTNPLIALDLLSIAWGEGSLAMTVEASKISVNSKNAVLSKNVLPGHGALIRKQLDTQSTSHLFFEYILDKKRIDATIQVFPLHRPCEGWDLPNDLKQAYGDETGLQYSEREKRYLVLCEEWEENTFPRMETSKGVPYDPSFVLPVLLVLVQHQDTDLWRFVERGLISIAIVGLSSFQLSTRRISTEILAEFIARLENSRFKEKRQLQVALETLQNGITEPFQRIPPLFSVLYAHIMPLMLKPGHTMYRIINQHILRRAYVDFSRLPLLLKLVLSGEQTFCEERSWILRIIEQSIYTFEDFSLIKKGDGLGLLYSLWNSGLLDSRTEMQVRSITHRLCTIPDLAVQVARTSAIFSKISCSCFDLTADSLTRDPIDPQSSLVRSLIADIECIQQIIISCTQRRTEIELGVQKNDTFTPLIDSDVIHHLHPHLYDIVPALVHTMCLLNSPIHESKHDTLSKISSPTGLKQSPVASSLIRLVLIVGDLLSCICWILNAQGQCGGLISIADIANMCQATKLFYSDTMKTKTSRCDQQISLYPGIDLPSRPDLVDQEGLCLMLHITFCATSPVFVIPSSVSEIVKGLLFFNWALKHRKLLARSLFLHLYSKLECQTLLQHLIDQPTRVDSPEKVEGLLVLLVLNKIMQLLIRLQTAQISIADAVPGIADLLYTICVSEDYENVGQIKVKSVGCLALVTRLICKTDKEQDSQGRNKKN